MKTHTGGKSNNVCDNDMQDIYLRTHTGDKLNNDKTYIYLKTQTGKKSNNNMRQW